MTSALRNSAWGFLPRLGVLPVLSTLFSCPERVLNPKNSVLNRPNLRPAVKGLDP